VTTESKLTATCRMQFERRTAHYDAQVRQKYEGAQRAERDSARATGEANATNRQDALTKKARIAAEELLFPAAVYAQGKARLSPQPVPQLVLPAEDTYTRAGLLTNWTSDSGYRPFHAVA
jgi:hypothetical protein